MKKTDAGFSRLLQRYREGKCSEEEKAVMDQWFNSIHHEIADKSLDENADEIMERMWANIQSGSKETDDIIPLNSQKKWWRMWPVKIAAACLVLLLGFAAYRSLLSTSKDVTLVSGHDISEMTEVKNSKTIPQIITLPDNSQVTLDPGSSLYYAGDFGQENREITLKGSGFFEVSHDKKKPFFVFSDDIVTRVVGTSFTIRYNQNNLEVTVLTGKVIVEKAISKTPSGNEGVTLTPNQKVTYYQKQDHFVTGLVNEPVLVKPKTGQIPTVEFNFEDTPLSDVISVLEAAYGIEIVIKNEHIKSCPVKADLTQQPLYTKLDIICAALKSHYDVKGTTIIITGGECE